MTEASPFDQLGRLLMELGWIGFDQLQEGLSYSKSSALPLGMVLVERCRISRNELNAALEAQSSVRDRLLDPIHAIMALTIVGWSSVTFRTALKFLGLESQKVAHGCKLGHLLIESNCISVLDCNAGLSMAGTIGLPLGQMLLMHQLISLPCLKMALEVQNLVRREVMTWNDAIHALKLTYTKPDSFAPPITVPMLPELRLGELLVLSNIVSRDDIKMALEIAQSNQRHLGEILSIFALVPATILTVALEIQRMLQRGEVTIDESVSALGQAYHRGVPLVQAIKNCRKHRSSDAKTLTLARFLEILGVMTDTEINEVSDACLDNSNILNKFQNVDRPLDQFAISAAARLNYLIRAAVLTLDAACFVFHHCLENRIQVDEFLKQAGWFQQVEPGSPIYVAHNGTFALV